MPEMTDEEKIMKQISKEVRKFFDSHKDIYDIEINFGAVDEQSMIAVERKLNLIITIKASGQD